MFPDYDTGLYTAEVWREEEGDDGPRSRELLAAYSNEPRLQEAFEKGAAWIRAEAERRAKVGAS